MPCFTKTLTVLLKQLHEKVIITLTAHAWPASMDNMLAMMWTMQKWTKWKPCAKMTGMGIKRFTTDVFTILLKKI